MRNYLKSAPAKRTAIEKSLQEQSIAFQEFVREFSTELNLNNTQKIKKIISYILRSLRVGLEGQDFRQFCRLIPKNLLTLSYGTALTPPIPIRHVDELVEGILQEDARDINPVLFSEVRALSAVKAFFEVIRKSSSMSEIAGLPGSFQRELRGMHD